MYGELLYVYMIVSGGLTGSLSGIFLQLGLDLQNGHQRTRTKLLFLSSSFALPSGSVGDWCHFPKLVTRLYPSGLRPFFASGLLGGAASAGGGPGVLQVRVGSTTSAGGDSVVLLLVLLQVRVGSTLRVASGWRLPFSTAAFFVADLFFVDFLVDVLVDLFFLVGLLLSSVVTTMVEVVLVDTMVFCPAGGYDDF